MKSRRFARAALLAALAISLAACGPGAGLHGDLASLAKGDYSRIADPATAESVRSAVDGGTAAWTRGDINGDGEPELILLDTTQRPAGRPQPILGVFYLCGENTGSALLDFNDSTEYYFLGPRGSVVYYYLTSGAVLSEQYYRCAFVGGYDPVYTSGLVIANFLDGKDLNGEPLDGEKWAEEHPALADMPLEGVHYIRLSSESGKDRLAAEEIDEESFLAEYKALTGRAFSDPHERYSA